MRSLRWRQRCRGRRLAGLGWRLYRREAGRCAAQQLLVQRDGGSLPGSSNRGLPMHAGHPVRWLLLAIRRLGKLGSTVESRE